MRILVSMVALALLATPALAGLVAYEGFTGEPGLMHGTASGFGLNAWNNQSAEPGYQVTGPGLEFGALQVAGNKGIGGGAYRAAGLTIAMPAPWDADNGWEAFRREGPGDTRYRAGAEGTTLWSSVLLQDFDANGVQLDFHGSHIGWGTGGVTIELKVVDGMWTLAQKSGLSLCTNIARNIGETYLLVARFEFLNDTTDRVTLYVNPTPGLASPDVAGAILETAGDFGLLGVRFYPGSNNNSGAMDELRFGDSYAAVTPVPEPASLAVLALGGLLIRRRR